ncbi:hypothetical protein OG21DRAFT_1494559 [Imleria badia]|nr:hypothetical protein OG21DRAFT_1494559 [Imleria badia]
MSHTPYRVCRILCRSLLSLEARELIEANRTISELLSASETAQAEAERLRSDNADLQSTLDARIEAVNEANRTISNIESVLETARCDNSNLQSALGAEKEVIVSDLQTARRDNANLQSALDARERAAIEANQVISDLGSALETTGKDAVDLQEAQSQLISVPTELQARISSDEDKDRTIATLNAQIEQWKRADAAKAQELEQLQRKLSTSSSELDALERSSTSISEETRKVYEENTSQIAKLPQPHDVQSCVQYGVICALPVDANDEEHISRKDQWELDPTGDCYVPGFFESKLRMGTHAREEMEFREPFSLIGSDPADFGAQTVRILSYRGSLSDPKWVDEDECKSPFFSSRHRSEREHSACFSTFCTIHVDLSEAVKDLVMKKDASGQVYYQLDYDVIVSFGRTDLHAELCWIRNTGERRISATVTYEG